MSKRNDRLTIVFDSHTKLQIEELCKAQNIGYSLLVRTIVSNFFSANEDTINRIIDRKNNDIDNATN